MLLILCLPLFILYNSHKDYSLTLVYFLARLHCQTVNAIQTSCKNVNFYFNISILMNFIKKGIKKYHITLKKRTTKKNNNKSSSILYCIRIAAQFIMAMATDQQTTQLAAFRSIGMNIASANVQSLTLTSIKLRESEINEEGHKSRSRLTSNQVLLVVT